MKRCFINQVGEANKFWNIETIGFFYVVTFGKIGAKGRENRKELLSAEACEAEAAKLIQGKLKKGYLEIKPDEVASEKHVVVCRIMDEALFWEILASFNWKRVGDDEAVMRPAEKKLASLSVNDIFAFDEMLAEKLYQVDGEQYAAACYPGEDIKRISADSFLYDRCSVLLNGRAFYEAVVADPTKWPVGMEFESLLYLAERAYARKTKSEEYPYSTTCSFETGSNKAGWPDQE